MRRRLMALVCNFNDHDGGDCSLGSVGPSNGAVTYVDVGLSTSDYACIGDDAHAFGMGIAQYSCSSKSERNGAKKCRAGVFIRSIS